MSEVKLWSDNRIYTCLEKHGLIFTALNGGANIQIITGSGAAKAMLEMREAYKAQLANVTRERDEARAGTETAVSRPQPDWATAPAWAEWWSIEPDGNINWFEHEPQVMFFYWCDTRATKASRVIGGFVTIPLGIDWRTLKQQRPAQESEV